MECLAAGSWHRLTAAGRPVPEPVEVVAADAAFGQDDDAGAEGRRLLDGRGRRGEVLCVSADPGGELSGGDFDHAPCLHRIYLLFEGGTALVAVLR
jgi:hypothetical protein